MAFHRKRRSLSSCFNVLYPLISALLLLIPFEVVARPPAPASDTTEAPRDPFDAVVNHLYNLEYDTAYEQLEAWLEHHPADLRALNDLATVLLHREMFRQRIQLDSDTGGALRRGKAPVTPAFRGQFFATLDKAEKLAEDRLRQNPSDQEAIYWAGSAHATRAVFYFSAQKAYLPALRESMRARHYHAQLLAMNPDYVDALLVVGTNDYIAGSLPWYVKVMASLTRYHGNRQRGIMEVQRVAQEGHYAREDAKFVLATLYRREKMCPETLRILEELAQMYPHNFLLRREIAQIQQKYGHARDAALSPALARASGPSSKTSNSLR